MKDLDYKVIATGSSGNAVRIEDIMIDCGIPFSHMEEDLYKVDSLLITHSHNDHIKEGTLNKIRKEFPRITVYANYDVAYRYKVDVVVGTSKIKLRRKRQIWPFNGVHDVPVTGYLIFMNGLNIIYMTDSSRVKIPDDDMLFDYVFLESNYNRETIKQMSKQYRRKSYNPYESSVLRHLSTQDCKEFYYTHRRNEESKLIELHQSSRFY